MATNTPTTQQETPKAKLQRQLKERQQTFQQVLPKGVDVERFMNLVSMAVQRDPQLLEANRQSLMDAAKECANDGLLPDGREAAFVMFKDKVQYMPMYAGLLKKIRNSGDVAKVSAHVVHENDHFEYVLGDDERIEHRPNIRDAGKPIAVYAIAHFRDDHIDPEREVMSVEEVEKVRQASRAKNGGPWTQWWSEMAKKTVIRRLSKRLPMSTEADRAIRRDDALYDLGQDQYAEVPGEERQAVTDQTNGNGTARLNQLASAYGVDEGEEQTAATNGNGQADAALTLCDRNGVVQQEYQRGGSFLNALEKMLQAEDPGEGRQAVWAANAGTVSRLYQGSSKSRSRIDELHRLAQEIPNQPEPAPAPEPEGEPEEAEEVPAETEADGSPGPPADDDEPPFDEPDSQNLV